MAPLLFTLFAALTLGCAAGVVFNRNTVGAALCLLLCLVGVAGLFAALDAFLLAFLLLLVYAGAIVALFLFIIMLLGAQGEPPRPETRRIGTAAGIGAAALLLAGLVSLTLKGRLIAASPAGPALGSLLKAYAYPLFTVYLLPVEIVGFLLLIAMVGVIALAHKPGKSGG